MAELEPANLAETTQKTIYLSVEADGFLAELVEAEPQWQKPNQSRTVEALIREAYAKLKKSKAA